MTRNDFEVIAGVIASLNVSDRAREAVAYTFARKLAETNPRFNRAMFLRASGV